MKGRATLKNVKIKNKVLRKKYRHIWIINFQYSLYNHTTDTSDTVDSVTSVPGCSFY